jgi:hypothetical protein
MILVFSLFGGVHSIPEELLQGGSQRVYHRNRVPNTIIGQRGLSPPDAMSLPPKPLGSVGNHEVEALG